MSNWHSSRKLRDISRETDWSTRVDPVEYVITHHDGGGVSGFKRSRLIATLQKENMEYLRRMCDADGDAVAYHIGSAEVMTRHLASAKKGDRFGAWDGIALRYALGRAGSTGRLNDASQIVELQVHEPVPDKHGLLGWDCDASQSQVTEIYGLDQVEMLVQRADLHAQALRVTLGGQALWQATLPEAS